MTLDQMKAMLSMKLMKAKRIKIINQFIGLVDACKGHKQSVSEMNGVVDK